MQNIITMKKAEIKDKLSLDKMTIAKLNDNSISDVKGGAGIFSIGNPRSVVNCPPTKRSKGIWCDKG